jgi:hypothetical protein
MGGPPARVADDDAGAWCDIRSQVSRAASACPARPVDWESRPSNPTEKVGSCASRARAPPATRFPFGCRLFPRIWRPGAETKGTGERE